MRAALLRSGPPVLMVVCGLLAFAIVIVIGITYGHALGHAARVVLAVVLLFAVIPNGLGLWVMLRASRGNRVMDERIQQAILGTFASLMFAAIGANIIWPVLPFGFGDVLLVLGVLVYVGGRLLFLGHYFRQAKG